MPTTQLTEKYGEAARSLTEYAVGDQRLERHGHHDGPVLQAGDIDSVRFWPA